MATRRPKTMKAGRHGNNRKDHEPDGGEAFIPDVARTHERLVDDAAESFAEEFIASVTSGEFVGEDARDEWSADEVGDLAVFEIEEPDLGAFTAWR